MYSLAYLPVSDVNRTAMKRPQIAGAPETISGFFSDAIIHNRSLIT